MRLSRVATSESHPHLESGSRLLRNHSDWSTTASHTRERFEELADLRFAAAEKSCERMLPAGMPGVGGYESLTAFWAAPKTFKIVLSFARQL